MLAHSRRSYPLSEHIIAVAAIITTFALFVYLFSTAGMEVCTFASRASISEARSRTPSVYVASTVVMLQLACVTLLSPFIAASGAVMALGLGMAVLAIWADRTDRGRIIAVVLVLLCAVLAFGVASRLRERLSGLRPSKHQEPSTGVA
jgi:hypothetical protein